MEDTLQDKEAIPPIALWLGIGGLIPFLAPALLIWMPLSLGWQGIAGTFGMVYGAIILSFLGGVRWGGALSEPCRIYGCDGNRLVAEHRAGRHNHHRDTRAALGIALAIRPEQDAVGRVHVPIRRWQSILFRRRHRL